jgi:hypothetical protein
MFVGLTSFPIVVIFWRASNQTLAIHRNPLFDRALGLTPYRCLTIDVLHTLHLGVYASWCKLMVWLLLDNTIWGIAGMTADERHQAGVLAMRADLASFYRRHREQNPDDELTPVNDLTVKMFGSRSDPALHMSGAETWGFLLYLLWAGDKYKATLSAAGQVLREAGLCLQRIQLALRRSGPVPSPAQIQDRAVNLEPSLKKPHDYDFHLHDYDYDYDFHLHDYDYDFHFHDYANDYDYNFHLHDCDHDFHFHDYAYDYDYDFHLHDYDYDFHLHDYDYDYDFHLHATAIATNISTAAASPTASTTSSY